MTYAAPLKVTIRLTVFDKDPRPGRKTVRDIKEQEVFFGEIPLMTRQRHLHHQRHRARHRHPVAPLAGRVLRARSGAGLLPRQDHPLPRKLGRVRVRQQEPAVRPHRPQAQVLRHGLPARARAQDATSRSSGRSTASPSSRSRTRSSSGTSTTRLIGMQALPRHHHQGRRDGRHPGQEDHASTISRRFRRPRSSRWKSPPNDLEGACVAADVVDMATGEVLIEANQELTATDARPSCIEAGIEQLRGLLPRARRGRHRRSPPRSARTRSRARTKRCSKSTASCAPAIRRRSTPPRSSSRACSSTRASTTSRAWAA